MKLWRAVAPTATIVFLALCGCGGGDARSPHGGSGQPNMEAARGELKAARAHLERAEHNKGGHRVRAIELTEQAITEVDKGIAAGDGP